MWSICGILTEHRRETADSSSFVQILPAVQIKGSKKHLFFNFGGIFPQYQHCFSHVFSSLFCSWRFFLHSLHTQGLFHTHAAFHLFGVRCELTVFRRAFVNF